MFRRIKPRLVAGVVVIVAVAAAGSPIMRPIAARHTVARTEPLDPAIASQIKADPAKPMRAFVHADTIGHAVAAARASHVNVIDRFDKVGVAVVEAKAAGLPALLGFRGVSRLEADAPIQFMTDTSHRATRSREARDVFKTTTPAFADTVNGSGVSIAVIDSGVDGTHPMFQRADGTSRVVKNQKLLCSAVVTAATSLVTGDAENANCGPQNGSLWVDFTGLGNDTDTVSLGGHGTHVATTAAGADYIATDGRLLSGAAPAADVVALSVGQFISVYAGVAGMAWVLDHWADPCGNHACPPIRVINNSWGPVIVGATYNPDDVTSKIQDELVEAGVTVVWAAGNGDATNDGGDGSDTRTGPYGQSPTPGIISVANYDDGNTGTREGSIDSSSSRGQSGHVGTYPDIAAPGTNITAGCRVTLAVCLVEGGALGDDGTMSGTSMAAPHIAGIAAQLLQVDPSLTPGEIENVLEDTAHKFHFGAPYEPDLPGRNDTTTSFDKGHGLVDATNAIASLLGVNPAPTPPVEDDPFAFCVAAGPVIADPVGDATFFAGANGLPNEPGLDITELRLTDDPNNVVFRFSLADLSEQPTSKSLGNSIESDFVYGGVAYRVSVYWANGAPSASLDQGDLLGGYAQIDVPTPVLDYTGNTITVPVDRAVFEPDLVNGSALSGFLARTRYDESPTPLGPVADDTTGSPTCPYTVGYGAIPPPAGSEPPPPPPPPPPSADATLSKGGPAYSWQGEKTTGADPLVAPSVTVAGKVHDLRLVHLDLADGETGTLTATVKTPPTSYVFFEIRDKEGRQLAYTEGLPTESLVLTAPDLPAGDYVIDVGYLVAAVAVYSASASLT